MGRDHLVDILKSYKVFIKRFSKFFIQIYGDKDEVHSARDFAEGKFTVSFLYLLLLYLNPS